MKISMSPHRNEMCDHMVPMVADNEYVDCDACVRAYSIVSKRQGQSAKALLVSFVLVFDLCMAVAFAASMAVSQ